MDDEAQYLSERDAETLQLVADGYDVSVIRPKASEELWQRDLLCWRERIDPLDYEPGVYKLTPAGRKALEEHNLRSLL